MERYRKTEKKESSLGIFNNITIITMKIITIIIIIISSTIINIYNTITIR